MPRDLSAIQIITRVRGVFARHWIDLGLMTVMYSQGTVRLQGRIQKLQQAGDPVDEMLLGVIEQEIRRVPDVKRVHFNFENWVKTSVGWEAVERKRPGARAGAGTVVYVSDTDEEKKDVPDDEAAEDEESPPS